MSSLPRRRYQVTRMEPMSPALWPVAFCLKAWRETKIRSKVSARTSSFSICAFFSDGRSTFAAAPLDERQQPEALTRLGGDEFTVLAALDYVAWLNRDPMRPAIHGINLSLAIPFEVDSHACGRTPICDACDRLVWNGTVVVAAARNSGFDKDHKQARLGVGYRGMTITDPGNAREVITVGATHHSEPHTYGVSYFFKPWPDGRRRMKPDIVAPGEKIRSTAPGGKMLLMDGTSMAAPHVSGVCALLMDAIRN